MERTQLDASLRSVIGGRAVKRLRNEGFVPGVVYGKNIEGGTMEVQVSQSSLSKLLAVHPSNALLDLNVADRGVFSVIMKEIQRDVIKRHPTHVDFNQVNLTEKMITLVTIHLVGTAKGVKDGGMMEQVAREMSVYCLPTDIPEVIEVSVAELGLGEKIIASSITLPANVELAGEPEQVIARVVEVVEKADDEKPAVAEPEVIREKKTEPKA